MNSTPKPTTNYPRGHPTEIQQIIAEKTQNFVGREFVFAAINQFLHHQPRGYFTLIGAPGSGKTALLAQYALNNPHVVYYNAELEGKNRAEEFLRNICTQLAQTLGETSPQNPPDNASAGSWYFSRLLQTLSDELPPNQKLIIAIDGLNCIDRNSQPPGTNLFYLPRYLPHRVFFLLTRRPFLREKSGLLIEAPTQSLDLANFPQENERDIQRYLQTYREQLRQTNLQTWLNDHHISEQEFCNYLLVNSENNFMYLSQTLNAIGANFYPQPFESNQYPPGLAAYYQQHLQQMLPPAPGNEFHTSLLKVLANQQQSISVDAIAHIINADEYEVAEILENWHEYLQLQQINAVTHYSLYHSNFRDWLKAHLY